MEEGLQSMKLISEMKKNVCLSLILIPFCLNLIWKNVHVLEINFWIEYLTLCLKILQIINENIIEGESQ